MRRDGEVVGRVRSCAYAIHRRPQRRARHLPAELEPGDEVEVEVLGEPVPATVAEDVLYDPEHARVRA